MRHVTHRRHWLLLPFVVTLAAMAAFAPDPAEAARKRQGGYSPPYADIVVDVNSGRVLRANQPDALRHPASVTKVMTLYMLFEQIERGRFRLDSELRVSAHAASRAPSKLGLRAGETIEVEDAIKALVTKSANDVASVIAEAIGGDEDEFGEMMTRKARALGMTRTTFTNASGLPDPAQVTTARDLTVLGRAIHDHFPRYWRYFQTRDFNFAGRHYRNHNRLLGRVDGVDGIKTGYTRASGFNLLTSAKVGNRHVIAVVLGGRSGRARDAQMASLVQQHLPTAYAGARIGPQIALAPVEPRTSETRANENRANESRTTEARVTERAAERGAPVQVAAPVQIAALAVAAPRPATETRTAEPRPQPARTSAQPVSAEPTPPVRAVAATSTAMRVGALTNVSATTPGTPGMRWVVGAQPALQARSIREPLRVAAGDERRNLGNAIAYTNSTATRALDDEDEEPTPANQRPVREPAKTAAPEAVKADVRSEPAKVAEVRATEPAREQARQEQARQDHARTDMARSGWVIQVGATDDERKARSMLDSIKARHRTTLGSANPFTEKVQKGDQTLFRARFGGFDADDAQAACKAVKAGGSACFAQRI